VHYIVFAKHFVSFDGVPINAQSNVLRVTGQTEIRYDGVHEIARGRQMTRGWLVPHEHVFGRSSIGREQIDIDVKAQTRGGEELSRGVVEGWHFRVPRTPPTPFPLLTSTRRTPTAAREKNWGAPPTSMCFSFITARSKQRVEVSILKNRPPRISFASTSLEARTSTVALKTRLEGAGQAPDVEGGAG
tara:strand:+ start:5481 stop:6044 length:564 start_codon:yes stop_codon:yes gene_type:complete